jgi:hypothetical protein
MAKAAARAQASRVGNWEVAMEAEGILEVVEDAGTHGCGRERAACSGFTDLPAGNVLNLSDERPQLSR